VDDPTYRSTKDRYECTHGGSRPHARALPLGSNPEPEQKNCFKFSVYFLRPDRQPPRCLSWSDFRGPRTGIDPNLLHQAASGSDATAPTGPRRAGGRRELGIAPAVARRGGIGVLKTATALKLRARERLSKNYHEKLTMAHFELLLRGGSSSAGTGNILRKKLRKRGRANCQKRVLFFRNNPAQPLRRKRGK